MLSISKRKQEVIDIQLLPQGKPIVLAGKW